MRLLGRIIVGFITATAAFAAVALSVLWTRSIWIQDVVHRAEMEGRADGGYGKWWSVYSGRGGLGLRYLFGYTEAVDIPVKHQRPQRVEWVLAGLWTDKREANVYPFSTYPIRHYVGRTEYQHHDRWEWLGFVMVSGNFDWRADPEPGQIYHQFSVHHGYAAPYWSLVLVTGFFPAWRFWRWRRRSRVRRRRIRLGLCVICGYDLRGTGSNACPECGATSSTVTK